MVVLVAKTRKTLLCGVAAFVMATPVLAESDFFRFVAPNSKATTGTTTDNTGGPPSAGTNDGPPGIGSNATDPVLTLTGVGANTTQPADAAINGAFSLTGGPSSTRS